MHRMPSAVFRARWVELGGARYVHAAVHRGRPSRGSEWRRGWRLRWRSSEASCRSASAQGSLPRSASRRLRASRPRSTERASFVGVVSPRSSPRVALCCARDAEDGAALQLLAVSLREGGEGGPAALRGGEARRRRKWSSHASAPRGSWVGADCRSACGPHFVQYRWVTRHWFQAEVVGCLFQCSAGAGESLEHYLYCLVVGVAARRYLGLQFGVVVHGAIGTLMGASLAQTGAALFVWRFASTARLRHVIALGICAGGGARFRQAALRLRLC